MQEKIDLLPLRISSKINVDPITGCWIWGASKNISGYGWIRSKGNMRGAHRVVYELLIGELDFKIHLHHICENTSCCNPYHLEPVTRKQHASRHPLVPMALELKSRTHCPQGHEYTPENSMPRTGGKRCLICHRAQSRAGMQRHRDRAIANR
jgi:hypothetical protein